MGAERDRRWSELLRAANRGDGAAYAAFLTEVAPVIRTVVAGRGRSLGAEVEDVVQEVLIALHTKRHTWRESEPVAPWLYAIARYKTLDAARAGRRRGQMSPLDEAAEPADERLPEPGAAGDVARLLARLGGGEGGRAARIVRALGIEGRSAAEVAAREGMSEGAVRVAYHRAMAELKAGAGATEREP
ncbi:sigma-70 family RNA polymerase sigma factor [Pseudoroseicyclus sp. CXY001]|uniref:sigma-70 family RNA polymerase sigma factor n=1 Tax=Pseudoroseicyclus sp. CXY001 TaxID=3242492 RepID=UPI003571417C